MDWDKLRRSGNVEDVRGGGGVRRRGVPLTLGGVAVALIASYFLGINPMQLLNATQGLGSGTSNEAPSGTPINDSDSDFVRAILGDTEDVWNRAFPKAFGRPYPAPKLVLFAEGVDSACGSADTSAGPFYCPPDQRVYLDMAFFKYLKATAQDGAEFARAYAIAHEVGHHVQGVLGVLQKVQSLKRSTSKEEANALQVRVELQADCYAGVWGHFTAQRALVDRSDIQGALDAAAQIGDDYLQKQAGRAVTPESFTHGSSKDRMTWFQRGLESGDATQCDTFR